jgi:hypothetical protein
MMASALRRIIARRAASGYVLVWSHQHHPASVNRDEIRLIKPQQVEWKLALGERAVMADGGEYVLLQLKEAGRPVEPVYATEGTPLIVGPNGIFKQAPNPNAARADSATLRTLNIGSSAVRSPAPLLLRGNCRWVRRRRMTPVKGRREAIRARETCRVDSTLAGSSRPLTRADVPVCALYESVGWRQKKAPALGTGRGSRQECANALTP